MVFVTVITLASLSRHEDDMMPLTNTIERELYPSQTKISEGWTKGAIRMSKEALFEGVSPLFGLRTIEKCFLRHPDCTLCSSFRNLRLGAYELTVWVFRVKGRACQSF